jgi:DNA invertase Pin-like site-specific DNA recombinase
VLVVAKRDRLARDVFTDALVQRLCERQGAVVRSADGVANGDRPEDQLMRSIMAAMAAYERALIRSRTKAALAVKKARGERVGGIPYGWRLGQDGKLVEDEREQEAVALARRLRAEGASLRGVGAGLDEAGFRPRNGKQWHVAVLARIVSD